MKKIFTNSFKWIKSFNVNWKGLITFLLSLLIVQSSFAWSWPQCRNSGGSTSPGAPSGTIYVGDSKSFTCDSWGTVDGKLGKAASVISTNSDLTTSALTGSWSNYTDQNAKSVTSPNFTSSGTWYWGIKVEYTDAGGTTGWYCRNNANWNNMYGSPSSNLTVTVSALNNPSSQSASGNSSSSTSINLSWSKDAQNHNVMIVCSTNSTFGTPAGGTAYTANTAYGSGSTINDGSANDYVVYNSNGTSATITNLTAGTTYYFKFYSENNSYYSSGVTANATSNVEVTFNANSGSGTMSNQVVTYNSATALTSNSFTRSGYTFSGWNTAANGSGTSYSNGANVTLTANTTLYAQWTASGMSISGTTSSVPASSTTQTYKGATITINGSGLGSVNSVKIGGSGGTACTNVSASSTQVTAVVPDGTANGTIYVSDGTNNATSSDSYTNLGFISTTTGNWTTGSTWLGGTAPSSTDKATIANSHTVTLDATSTIAQSTINSGGTYNGSSNALTISGNLTNNGTFTAGTGKVVFSGAATIAGSNAITFNNLTLNGATTMTTTPSISGILLVNNASASILTNRVTYNSGSTLEFAVSKTIGSADMFWETNISSTGSSQKGVPWNVTVDASQTLTFSDTYPYYMNGNMLISGSLTLGGAGSGTWGNLYLRGNFTNNGTFTHNTREVIFNGTSAQTINGTLNTTGTTNCFAYLTIYNTSGGVTLNNLVNVINKLTLTSGIVTTSNTNILNITATDASNSLSGGSSTSFINGPLKRAFASGTASDWIFPVGKGTTFLPCAINTPTGTSPITAEAFTSNCGGSSTGYALSTSEYWQISGNTLTAGYVTLAKAGTSASVVAYSSTANGTYTSLGGSGVTVCSVTGVKAANTANPLTPNYFALASATEPTTQATVLAFSNVTSSGMTLTWTNGNGSNRVVVAKQGSAPTGTPADGTAYTANAAYGTSGTSLGDGFVVYNGNSNTVNATGLTAGTTYYFAVYEYNGSGTSSNYLTTTPATGNQMTLAAATITATPTSATYSAQVGETSASQSFAITGSNLTTDITVTAPAYYQVSTDNSTWSASAGSVTFTQTAGSVSGTLYVRYVPTAGEASVAKNVTLASTGATTVNIAVTGTAAKTITIKFQKPTTEWTSTPYIYAWNGGTITPSAVAVWQGVQMNDIGSGWYSYTLSFTNTTVNFKFNIGGTYQSSNITGISTSNCWASTDADGAPGVAYTTKISDCPNNMYYRSVASGDWNSTTSWEQSVDNATWVAASSVPSSSANGVLISTNNTVTVSSGVTSPSSASFIVNGTLSFTASSATVSTAPTYSSGSTLKYDLGAGNSRSVGTEWTENAQSGAGYPYNITVASGTVNIDGIDSDSEHLYIAGDLNISTGATLYCDMLDSTKPWNQKGLNISGDIINSGTLTLSSSSNQGVSCDDFTNYGQTTLSSNAIGGDFYITGNFYNNGSSASAVNINGRALILTGNKDQIIGGTATGTYEIDYFIVAKSNKPDGSKSKVTLEKDILADGEGNSASGGGAVTVNDAILDISGHTVQIARNQSNYYSTITTNSNGVIRSNSSSKLYILGDETTKNLGTLRFDQTTPGTTNIIGVLRLNRSNSQAQVDIANDLVVRDSLKIQQGKLNSTANITLDSVCTATMHSTNTTASLNVNNLLFIRSLNNSAEFYRNSRTFTISGTAHTKVHFARLGKWHFISFPYDVTIKKSDNSTAATIGTSSADGDLAVYWYDPAKRATNVSGWTQLTTGGSTLTAGKAYIIAKRNTFEDLYFNPTSSVQGGNNFFTTPQTIAVTYTSAPVSCNAGWNFVAQPISVASLPTLTDGEFAYNYNAANDQYKLYFYEYNPGYSYTGGSIKPFSSVFVKSAAAGNVSFGSSTPQGIIRKKVSTENPESIIPLRLNVNNIEYETLIRVKTEATTAQDELYDAPYSTPMSSSSPRLYSLIDGVSYSLNSIPEGNTIPIGLRVPASGTYTFSWDTPTNGLQPTLTDSQGATTDMTTNTSYEFSTSVSGDINTRFLITVPKRVVTNIDVTNKSEYKIHTENNKITIEGLNISSKTQLFDITGKLIHSKYVINSTDFEVSNKGIYILQISNKNGVQSLKIVVH